MVSCSTASLTPAASLRCDAEHAFILGFGVLEIELNTKEMMLMIMLLLMASVMTV